MEYLFFGKRGLTGCGLAFYGRVDHLRREGVGIELSHSSCANVYKGRLFSSKQISYSIELDINTITKLLLRSLHRKEGDQASRQGQNFSG
jgi:hypothetical protein